MITQIRKNRSVTHILFLVYLTMFLPLQAYGLPQGGTVVSGQAGISRPSALDMKIQQATQKAIINWNSFSIGASEAVTIAQPGASSISLNRVVGIDPSLLDGLLSSNGRVFLINPNGIMVGPTGRINVNSFIGSSLDIADQDFLNDEFVFTVAQGAPLSQILNQGNIAAAEGGFVSLMGPSVQNAGTIAAKMGKVYLAGAEKVTLNFAGNDLVGFVLDESVKDKIVGFDGQQVDSTVSNTGKVSAAGGEVILSASTAKDLVQSVVNNEGVVEAVSMESKNGVIRLLGGDEGIVSNSGLLDASGTESGETGGAVHVLGEKIGLFDQGRIDVSGEAGGGEVLFGGEYRGEDPDVPNSRMAYLGPDSKVSADALGSGDGGRIIVWSDEGSQVYGALSARGGSISGDGGFVETSSKIGLDVRISPDVSAVNGAGGLWLIDPYNIEIVSAEPTGVFNAVSFAANVFESTGDDATLPVNLIEDVLNGGNSVTVETGSGGGATGGDITLSADLSYSGSHDPVLTLTLQADKNVWINESISTSGGALNVTLIANSKKSGSGVVSIANGANIATHGGAFEAKSNGGNVVIDGHVSTSNQNITINTAAFSGSSDGILDAGSGIIKIDADESINFAGKVFGATLELNAGHGYDINLTNKDNDVTDLKVFSGNEITIKETDDINLVTLLNIEGYLNVTAGGNVTFVGAKTLSADLYITSGGSILQSGGGTIGKKATLSAGTGDSIRLDKDNSFTTVSITQAGSVEFRDSGDTDTTFSVSNVSGSVTISKTQKDLIVGASGIAGESLDLEASVGAINGSGTLTGETITLAANGNIEASSASGLLVASPGITVENGGDVYLENSVSAGTVATYNIGSVSQVESLDVVQNHGDISANQVYAANQVSFTAEDGRIDATGSIQAGGVTLHAKGDEHGIGVQGITATGDVLLTTVNGSIDAGDTIQAGGVELNAKGDEHGIGVQGITATGDVLLTTVNGSIDAGDTIQAGGVELNAKGDEHGIGVQGITATGDVLLTTVNGSIDAAGNIQAGGVELNAGGDEHGIGVQGITATGDVLLTTVNGSIDAAGNIQAGGVELQAGGDEHGIGVQGITATGDVSLTAEDGGIDAAGNIQAGGVELQAGGDEHGIGVQGITATGDVSLTAEDGGIDAAGNIQAGGVELQAGGDEHGIGVQGITATGDISLTTVNGGIDAAGNIQAGGVELQAGGDEHGIGVQGITATGDVSLTAENGGIDAAGNIQAVGVELQAGGDEHGIGVQGITATGDALLTTVNGGIDAAGNIQAVGVELQAGGDEHGIGVQGITATGDVSLTTVNGGIETGTIQGVNVTLHAKGDEHGIDVQDITSTGTVSLTADNGGIDSELIDASHNVTLLAKGDDHDIIVRKITTTDNVFLTSEKGSILDKVDGATEANVDADQVTLTAGGNIRGFTEDESFVTKADNVTVNGATNADILNLDSPETTIYNASGVTGDLTITESGDMKVGSIAVDGKATLTSSQGSILDAYEDSDDDITANEIQLTTAFGSVGDDGQGGTPAEKERLDIATNTLTVNSDGNVYLKSRSESDGTVYLVDVASGDLNVVQTEKDILVNSISAGEVYLKASGGSIKDVVPDTDTDITGTSVTLSAGTDIGAYSDNPGESDYLDVFAGDASDTTEISILTAENILLKGTNPAGTKYKVQAVSGNVGIVQPAGNLEVESIVATGTEPGVGTVDLEASTGAITDGEGDDNADITAQSVVLSAQTTVGEQADKGSLITEAGSVTVRQATTAYLIDDGAESTTLVVEDGVSDGVHFTKNNADLLLGGVLPGNDTDVFLTASDGSILPGETLAQGDVAISAGKAELVSKTGIGDAEQGHVVETQVGTLVATVNDSGDVVVHEADQLVLGVAESGTNPAEGILASAGSIDIQSEGNMTVAGPVEAGEDKEHTLRLDSGGILTIDSKVSAGGDATIDLSSEGLLIVEGIVEKSGNGDVKLTSRAGNIEIEPNAKVITTKQSEASIELSAFLDLLLKDDKNGGIGLVQVEHGDVSLTFSHLDIALSAEGEADTTPQIIAPEGTVTCTPSENILHGGYVTLFGDDGDQFIKDTDVAQIECYEGPLYNLDGYNVVLRDTSQPDTNLSLNANSVRFAGDSFVFKSILVTAADGVTLMDGDNDSVAGLFIGTEAGPLNLNANGSGDVSLSVGNSLVDICAKESAAQLGNGEVLLGDVSISDSGTAPKLSIRAAGNVTLGSVDLADGVLLVNLNTKKDDLAAILTVGAITAGYVHFWGQDDDEDDSSIFGLAPCDNGSDSADWSEINLNGDVTVGKTTLETASEPVDLKTGILIEDAALVKLGDGADLTANTGNVSVFNRIGGIELAGSSVHGVTSELGSVELFDIRGSGTAGLKIHSGQDVTLESVDIGGALSVNLAESGNGGEFESKDLSAASVAVDGGSKNGVHMKFKGNVESTDGNIEISSAETISIDKDFDLTAQKGGIKISEAGQVTLGDGVDLTAQNGDIAMSEAIDKIVLQNTGEAAGNTITANNGAVSLASVEGQNNGTLRLEAANDIDLGSVNVFGNFEIAGAADVNANGTVNAGGSITVQNVRAGGTYNGNVNFGGDVTAKGNLTVKDIDGKVDLAGDVDLTSTNGDVSMASDNGVAGIYLSGAGVISINAEKGTVKLAAVYDGASPDALRISGKNVDIESVTIDGALEILVDRLDDTDEGGSLTAGTLKAGRIEATGTGTDDVFTFKTGMESTSDDIVIQQAGQIDFLGDVVSKKGLTVSGTEKLKLGSGISVAANGGDMSLVLDRGEISVAAGDAETKLTAGNNGSILLGRITQDGAQGDSGNAPKLTIAAEGEVSTQDITLPDFDLSIMFDSNDDQAGLELTTSAIQAKSIHISGGQTTNDVIKVRQNLDASDILSLANVETVSISQGVSLTANDVDIQSGVDEISIDGSGGETNIWAKTGVVKLSNIVDGGGSGLVKITAGTDAEIASASLQKDLEIEVGGVLTTGDLAAGSIRASGLGGNQVLDFQGELTSTSGEILVQEAQEVTFSENATAATDLNVENIGQTVKLGSSATLKAANGNVTFSGDNATLDLVGDPGTTNSIIAMGDGAKGNISLLKVTDSQDPNGLDITAQGASVETGQIDIGGDLAITFDSNGNEFGTIRLDEASANDIVISGGGDRNDRIEIVRASTAGEDISAGGDLVFKNVATVDLDGDVRLKAAGDVQANDKVGQIFLSGESGTANMIEATSGSVTVGATITDHASPDKLTIKAGKTVDLAEVDISGILEIIGGEGVNLHKNITSDGGFRSSGGTFDFTGTLLSTSDSEISVDHSGQVSLYGKLSPGAGDIHVDSDKRIDIRETGGIQTTTGSVFLGKNSGGEIGLAANISTQGGDVLFYSNTKLTENILLDTGSGSGDVFFGGDLTGKGELAITSGAGTARFEGTVDLGGLSITANQIDLPTITTTGMQEYKGNISLRGDLNSGSGVRLDGPVTLLASVTVSGNAIDFEESVTGGQVLTLMGSSIAIQGTASVATLVANGTTSVLVHDVDTTGDQIYSGRTSVAGNLDSGNAIIFNSSATLASNEIEMEAQSDIIFHKTLDGKSSGGQVLRIQSSNGELTFMEAVGSKNKLGGLYVEEAGGGVFFLSTVVSEILEIRNTSNLVFSDDIIAENGFYVEIGDFENQAEAEIQTQTGPLTIKSTGNVSILSALRSGDGEIAISSEGANGVVLIDAAIESDKGGVNIFSAGQTIVTENGDIFTGTGDVVFGGEGSGEIFTGGDATTAGGSISFLAESYLTGPVVFSTGEEGGDIRFEGGLNAANGEAIDLSLFAGSGVVSFQGPVGDQHALASLKIEGAGGVTADGPVVADRVDFVNAGDVELKGDLTASDGFSSQGDAFLNTGKIETADADVIIQHQGPVAIQGDISAGAGAVDIDAIGPDATLSILAGIHTTTGLVTIDSMGGSVLGETGLVRTETGDILFGQDLSGALTLYGNLETSGGDILFASPVLVGGEVRVDTGEGPGDVTFQSVLDAVAPNRNDSAQRTLDILAGTGNVAFAGRTGGSNPLDALTVGPASSVTVQDALDAALVQFLEVETVVLNGDVAAANGFSSTGGTFDGERASITTQGADIAVEHTQNASFGGNLNSNGGKISLSAGGEMSLADGGSLDSSGGEIALAAGKNLTAGSSADISTGGGQLSIQTGEALDLGENFSVATQGGSATLASGADFTVGGGAAVETGGGGLSLVSSADLIAGEAASFRSSGGGLALESGLDLAAGQGVSLDSGGGSLGVASGQDLNIGAHSSLDSGTGSLSVRSGRNATFQTGVALVSSGGDASIEAADGLTLGDQTSFDAGTGRLSLTAGGDLAAGDQLSLTTKGDDLLVKAEGAMDIGERAALGSDGGELLLQSGGSSSIGNSAVLDSGAGQLKILSGESLTAGSNFVANAKDGDVLLRSDGTMSIGNGSAVNSGTGDLEIRSGQNLAAGSDVSVTSEDGTVLLSSNGAMDIGDGATVDSGTGELQIQSNESLTAGSNISVKSINGPVLLSSNGAMIIGDGATVDSGTGELQIQSNESLTAGSNISVKSINGPVLLSSNGAMDIGDGATVDSGTGELQIQSGESLTAGSNISVKSVNGPVLLSSNGAMDIGDGATVDSGTGELQIQSNESLTAGANVSVKSESGPVLLSSNGAMIIGDGATVDSGTGEMKIQSGESMTAGSNISVKSVNGPVFLSSEGAMDIGSGSTVDSGTGELKILSGEGMTAGANVSVKSESGPVLLSSNGAMDIGDGSTVDSGTGELKIQSGEGMTAGANIAVKSKNGPVFLSSEGAMDIGSGSTVDSGTGELKILSGEGMTAGGNVFVKSESGSVLLSSNGAMDIGDGSTVDSGTGELKVLSGESMTAGADVSLKSKSGPVLLSSDGAMDIGDRSVVDSGTGELQIRSGENLTAGSEVALNTDDNDMLLHSEGAMNIGNGTSVETNGGNAEIYAGGPMALDGQIRSGNGDIVVSGNDTVAMAPDNVIDAGSGKIAMNSGGAMTVTALQTTYKSSSDQDPAVTLSSRGGIFDAGNDGQNAAKDIDAAKGLLEVRSPLGIGTESNPLEISVSSLTVLSDIADGPLADMPNAAWTGDGVHGVYLDTAGGLFINDLKTIDGGNVFMTANGALSVVELAAEDGDVQLAASAIHGKTQDDGIDIEAKNIELHATEGAIKVGSIKAASTGKVTLIAELGIESGEGQTGYIRGGEGVFKSLNFGTNNSPLLIDLNSILFEANENVDQSTRVGLFSAAPGGAPAKGQINPVIPLNTYGVVMGYYGSIDTGKIFFFFIGGRDIEAYLLGLSSSTVQEEKLEEMLAALVASDTWEPPPPQDIPEIALEAQPAPSLTERDETFPTLLWYDRNETATVPGLSRRNPDWPRLDKSGLQAFFDYDPGLRGLL